MSHQDAYKTNIYVLNADGTPLMPCHSQRKARKWIKTGKAIVACQYPYTLQLTYQIDDPGLQPVIIGVNPGPNNIGINVIDNQGRSLIASDVTTDNPQVTVWLCVEAQFFRFGRKRSGKVRLYDMIVLIAKKNNYR